MEKTEMEMKLIDFKEIVSGFSSLLKTENEALLAFKLDVVKDLFEQKSNTVGVYRGFISYFIKHQEEIAALKTQDKEVLKVISEELNELIAQNEMLLKTRMETSKNVMNSIVNIAKINNKSNSTSYGSFGNYSPRESNYNALAINETL